MSKVSNVYATAPHADHGKNIPRHSDNPSLIILAICVTYIACFNTLFIVISIFN